MVIIILLLLFLFMKIQDKFIRMILIGLLSLSIIFYLWTVFIPIYNNWPDIEWFSQSQKNEIIIRPTGIHDEVKINIKGDINKSISVQNQEINLEFTPKNQLNIIFSSKNSDENVQVFIKFKEGYIFYIPPQSITSIINNSWIVITTNNWWEYNYIDKNNKFYINNIPQISSVSFKWNTLLQETKDKQRQYIIDKIGWDFMVSLLIRNISKLFINTLSLIDPIDFEKNKINYAQFEKYISEQNISQEQNNFNTQWINTDLKNIVKNKYQKTKFINF